MRDLIRKVLKDYINPVLVFEIKIKQNLQEAEYFIRFIKKDTPEIVLMKNDHSMDSIGESKFSRVDPDLIVDSINEFEREIVEASKEIVNIYEKNQSGLVVRDSLNGFDYHMWLKKRGGDSIYMIINTSIHHPEKLVNKEMTPVLTINSKGETYLKLFPKK